MNYNITAHSTSKPLTCISIDVGIPQHGKHVFVLSLGRVVFFTE